MLMKRVLLNGFLYGAFVGVEGLRFPGPLHGFNPKP